MPFIVATYVYASSQGQRTHSARTKIPWELCQPYWKTDNLVIEYSEEVFDNEYVMGDILEELD